MAGRRRISKPTPSKSRRALQWISLAPPAAWNRNAFSLPYGNASKAVVLESGDRTRLVLERSSWCPTKPVEGNNLFLVVGQEGNDYVKRY